MTTQEIKVPDIGEDGDVEVIEVHVKAGDRIEIDDPLITLESDKAAMDVPASQAGVVKEVLVKLGDKVKTGAPVLLLEGGTATSEPESPPESEPKSEQKPKPEPTDTGGKPPAEASAAPPSAPGNDAQIVDFKNVHASPVVRARARELNVDLTQVTGTGPSARVTRADVETFASGGKSAGSTSAAASGNLSVSPIPSVDFSKFGDTELSPLSKIKRLTAENLHRSWLNIPHVTHNDEADITDTEAFRKALKPSAEKAGVRVTLLSFFMKAVAQALQEFPTFNSSLAPDGQSLILKKYCNIGIAVDTPNGLVVPVIRDVPHKGLFAISADLADLSGKARDRKLKVGDMQGGSFTISSLGGIGGTSFTPIVNAPEVAILGLTRSKPQPVPTEDGFEFRLMQPMSLSYDHRVIDGAEAARFVKRLGELISDLRLMLI